MDTISHETHASVDARPKLVKKVNDLFGQAEFVNIVFTQLLSHVLLFVSIFVQSAMYILVKFVFWSTTKAAVGILR